MRNRTYILPSRSSSKSFTLIELIVVIIIVGILAAVGMTQYTKVVEKGRTVEARIMLGQMSKLAYQYWLENGQVDSIAYADVNVGTGVGQIPSACTTSYYFSYYVYGGTAGSLFRGKADRCLSGGKTPNGTGVYGDHYIILNSDFSTGSNTWQVYGF
ncbi:prepilin-type N-terminal cleavage/methylation domain-containing protein [bacterium]|nr:MAG: prepilin-type N-terminal cleavage/methylation domain-containing protein [bacterium]